MFFDTVGGTSAMAAGLLQHPEAHPNDDVNGGTTIMVNKNKSWLLVDRSRGGRIRREKRQVSQDSDWQLT